MAFSIFLQVSGLTTVELNVNMHCEACAAQLKRKILKMRGRYYLNSLRFRISLVIPYYFLIYDYDLPFANCIKQ